MRLAQTQGKSGHAITPPVRFKVEADAGRRSAGHGCHGLSAASTTTMGNMRAPATYRSSAANGSAASYDRAASIPPSKLWTKCVSVAAAKPRATMIAPDHVEPAACTDQSGFDLNKHPTFPGGRERRIDI